MLRIMIQLVGVLLLLDAVKGSGLSEEYLKFIAEAVDEGLKPSEKSTRKTKLILLLHSVNSFANIRD